MSKVQSPRSALRLSTLDIGRWTLDLVFEAKLLMLRHAFETFGCIRVEFKTDSLNDRSRKALLRIGAREEGILRNQMIVWDGRYRHSVYFSVIDTEWPEVRSRLEAHLGSRRGTSAT